MRPLNRDSHFTLSLFTAISALVLASGCSGPGEVGAGVELVDKTSQALTTGAMVSLNGTYGAGCSHRSGPWSVGIADGATLDHPVLSVIKNDTTCELTLTALETGTVLAPTLFDADPSMLLGGSYLNSASPFYADGAGGGAPVAFYANAKMSPTDFSASMVITFLFSDDPNAASGANNASFDTWQSSVSGNPVSAPNYTYTDNLLVKTDINSVVTTVSGTLDFANGSVHGEHYLVDLDTLPGSPTYDDINTVFSGGSPVTIGGTAPSIAISAFSLMGDTLPVVRTVIIQHVANNVPSYQILKVTFDGA